MDYGYGSLHDDLNKGEPCERCTRYYDHNKHHECPHCSDMDDATVRKSLLRLQRKKKAFIPLGYLFLVVSVILLLMVTAMAKSL